MVPHPSEAAIEPPVFVNAMPPMSSLQGSQLRSFTMLRMHSSRTPLQSDGER